MLENIMPLWLAVVGLVVSSSLIVIMICARRARNNKHFATFSKMMDEGYSKEEAYDMADAVENGLE